MSERDAATLRQAEKLIGGWVAGTLTESERALLLQASLSNQALFDALADEEGLRELLADPKVRGELTAMLAASASGGARPAEAGGSWWRWLFRPAPMAAFSAGVLAVLAFVVVRPEFLKQKAEPAPVITEAPAQAVDDTKDVAAAPAAVSGSGPARRAEPEKLREKASAKPMPASGARSKDADRGSIGGGGGGNATVAHEADAARKTAATPELVASGRLDKAAGPAAAGTQPATPPAPAVVAAPPPLPTPAATRNEPQPKLEGVARPAESAAVSTTATEAVSVRDEAKLKRAAAPPPPQPAPAARPPIRYRIERLQAGGEWVEFGGELGHGTQARLAIDASQAGLLIIRAGGSALTVVAQPGETVHFPASGGLPADAGEREVAIVFRPGAMGSAYGGALAAQPAQPLDYRSRAVAAPRQQQQQKKQTLDQQQQQQQEQRPGGGTAAQQQGGQVADALNAVVPGGAAAPEYSVTVRLRYR